ncbi:MAG: carbon-nitrogen hydrolase family protein [Ferruginibacter sp.]
MKICVVQSRPVIGDIESNIINHKRLIRLAIDQDAGIVIFPELSLTGYQPQLAKQLAVNEMDNRLNDFQQISDTAKIVIGVGIPVKHNSGVCIGMVIFQPNQSRKVYAKKYLHSDEDPFFVSGENYTLSGQDKIALAICYELSVPEHSANAFENGAKIYIASVAKPAAGVEKASETLAGIARKYTMTVLMSNCLGDCYDCECSGQSAIWDSKGLLCAQLNNADEGLLILDTGTGEIIKKQIDELIPNKAK